MEPGLSRLEASVFRITDKLAAALEKYPFGLDDRVKVLKSTVPGCCLFGLAWGTATSIVEAAYFGLDARGFVARPLVLGGLGICLGSLAAVPEVIAAFAVSAYVQDTKKTLFG